MLALGASRARLICQLLSEALLLVLLSGGLGLFFTFWFNDLLVNFIPLPNLQPAALDLSLDARVAGFAVAVSLLTVVLFGMTPAWQSSKPELMSALKDRTGSQHRTLEVSQPADRWTGGPLVGRANLRRSLCENPSKGASHSARL